MGSKKTHYGTLSEQYDQFSPVAVVQAAVLSAAHYRLDGEIIELPDKLGGVDTSHTSHKNLLIKSIQALLFVSVTLCCIT